MSADANSEGAEARDGLLVRPGLRLTHSYIYTPTFAPTLTLTLTVAGHRLLGRFGLRSRGLRRFVRAGSGRAGEVTVLRVGAC